MTDRAASGRRIVRCPACGGESVYAPSNPYRPFCSARCKNNDFGAWASEAYCVSATRPDDDSPEGASDPEES
jgi:endogenous inhibitor of DNA gyrase (YacG/DUF329 family)